MREGWQEVRLGDVCKVVAGQSPKGSAYNNDGDGLPFHQGKKYFRETLLGDSKTWTTQITKEAFPGDILMSVRAPVGPINFTDQHMCIGRGLAAIRGKEKVDRMFLFYWLSFIQSEIQGNEGAVFASINKQQIENIGLPLPPLPEQNRIVAILDEAFVGIATAVANTEKNLANARELFESYLNAVVSRRGEGWSKSKIGDLVDLHQGLAINKGTKHLLVESGGLPLLRIKDLRNGNAEQFVASEGWPKNAKVGVDEIIYTRTGQIGLVFRGREGVLHNNCFKVVSKGKLSTGYLYWLLQGPDFRKAVIKLASRAAQPDITHKLFKEQIVSLPPAHFQDMAVPKIESLYGDVTTVRDIYHRKLDALSELKQSLLKKAFSGELTAVPQDEIETALA